jgi:hypothetical protein
MRRLALALSALLAVAAAAPPPAPEAAEGIALFDLDGRTRHPLAEPDARATVFVFTRTDCPISNRYAPELGRLHARFAPAGVAFWLVYPERTETADEIRRHRREFGYPMEALRDPERALVRAARATVTPEVAVFVRAATAPRLIYRGRIDDRYVAFGKARSAPSRRDLEDVLERIGAGRVPPARTTRAIGCFLSGVE